MSNTMILVRMPDILYRLKTLDRERAVAYIKSKYPGKGFTILNDQYINAATTA